MSYMRRPLQVGDRVKLQEAGTVHVVTHVSAASATLKPRGKRTTVTVPVKSKGKDVYNEDGTQRMRTFEAWEGGDALTYSVNAFVFPAEEE